MNIILPREKRNKALAINPKFLLLYSAPKCGKTTLLSRLPNSLILDIEDGSDYIDDGIVINIKKEAIGAKVGDLEYIVALGEKIKEEGKPYKYLVIDTASQLEVLVEKYATDVMYKNSTIGGSFKGDSVLELPRGAGYYWLRMGYAKWLDYLRELADTTILLCHIRDKMIVDKNGHSVEANDIDLTGKLKQITCSNADCIGMIYRKLTGSSEGNPEEELWVSFRSSGISAGSRSRHLTGKEFFLSKVVGQDEEIKVSWDSIFIQE